VHVRCDNCFGASRSDVHVVVVSRSLVFGEVDGLVGKHGL
jgi:hypothetical protein